MSRMFAARLIAGAALVAAPAALLAQGQPPHGTALGNGMGTQADSQPQSHAGDVASGAAGTPSGRDDAHRMSGHHPKPKPRRHHTPRHD